MVDTKDQSNAIVYAMLFVDSVDIHRENYWGGSLRKLWVEMHYKYLCLVSTVSTYIVFDMVEKPLVSAFQNFLRIENWLNIKKVIGRNV